jgi:hypothetical protein
MAQKLPTRNPSGTHRRKVVAARRIGLHACCSSCGEKRPEALIPNIKPTTCAACQGAASGRSPIDNHHFAGRANSPTTIPIPVNDHRAQLSVAQEDWPKSTLINAQRSPLLAGAASVRGFIDTVLYLIERGLLWIADMLEMLDEFLLKKLGPQWWHGTEVERFAPKGKSSAKS